MRAEEKLAEAFFERGLEWPSWLLVKNSRTLVITVDSWQRLGEYEVTVEDVVEYFAFKSGNILSGMRSLGSIVGDWRQIDCLAQFCHEVFKLTAIKGLKKLSRTYGLNPKY